MRGVGRHGMAINQQAIAELRPGFRDQPGQRGVIGLPTGADARLGLGKAELAAVDLLPPGHNPRQRAKPRPNTGAGAIDPGRQGFGEHGRVQFPGFPVHIAPNPGEAGGDQWRAMGGGGGKELIHKGILAPAQRERIHTGIQK